MTGKKKLSKICCLKEFGIKVVIETKYMNHYDLISYIFSDTH